MNAENECLRASRENVADWKSWGLYLSERQWGAVCEDYSDGGNGAGLGASRQTGWTGIVARLMSVFASITPEQWLADIDRVAPFKPHAKRARGGA